ncbi:MAG: hypothetical protein AAF358_19815 [Pseudomonadota bacterium]
MIYPLLHVGICVWLIWLGGAERLEGSFSTIFFIYPAMTATELKFFAFLSLLTVPFYLGLVV